MNKFVAALLRLLGGLIGVGVVVLPLAAAPRATQEPIPYPVWTIEDVALSGYDNALAVDSAGRPHLLYVAPANGALRYAVRQSDGWHYEDVADESADLPLLAYDLAIRPDGAVCLVYATELSIPSQPFDTKLVYGCRGAHGWELSTIDDGGRAPRLRFDDAGQPHIALIQDNIYVVYLTWADGRWQKDTVYTDSAYLNVVFLLLDSAGHPSVVFRGADGQFHAQRSESGSWASTPLTRLSIYTAALDANDALWLAVNDGESLPGHDPFFLARLKLVRPADSGPDDWELLDEGYDWQIAADMAFSDGIPYLAYIDPDGAAQVVWWDESGKHGDMAGAQGFSELSLAMHDGQPRLAFADDNQLKLASRDIILLDKVLFAPVIVGAP
ncbi:MAG TPA: hypothetical protein PK829_07905 [Promineifilum sp.]|nr:hypothetical protein [Promineifilum sp.]